MASLLDIAIERKIEKALSSFFASAAFKSRLRTHIKWAVQGFEDGYDLKDRAHFTRTVAAYIMKRARRPVYLFGRHIWSRRETPEFCAARAEQIVTDFLDGEKIKFGDPDYHWEDGHEIAAEDMSYWGSYHDRIR